MTDLHLTETAKSALLCSLLPKIDSVATALLPEWGANCGCSSFKKYWLGCTTYTTFCVFLHPSAHIEQRIHGLSRRIT
jgi:hypothetical protein